MKRERVPGRREGVPHKQARDSVPRTDDSKIPVRQVHRRTSGRCGAYVKHYTLYYMYFIIVLELRVYFLIFSTHLHLNMFYRYASYIECVKILFLFSIRYSNIW